MSRSLIFIAAFIMMSLQTIIAYAQFNDYRRQVKDMFAKGDGVIGVGNTKGIVRPGQLLLLKYSVERDQVIGCRLMEGRTVFARFKDVDDYNGMTLQEVRDLGIKLDAEAFRFRRRRHPYNSEELTKKKHALIQAVEAIEKRIASEESERLHREIIEQKRRECLSEA